MWLNINFHLVFFVSFFFWLYPELISEKLDFREHNVFYHVIQKHEGAGLMVPWVSWGHAEHVLVLP